MFYTVLLPNGVLHTVSPAFNCTLAQWVAGLGPARAGREPLHVALAEVQVARVGGDGRRQLHLNGSEGFAYK